MKQVKEAMLTILCFSKYWCGEWSDTAIELLKKMKSIRGIHHTGQFYRKCTEQMAL